MLPDGLGEPQLSRWRNKGLMAPHRPRRARRCTPRRPI